MKSPHVRTSSKSETLRYSAMRRSSNPPGPICPPYPPYPMTRSIRRSTLGFIEIDLSILTKREIEPPVDVEPDRRRSRENARDPVIPQPCGAAEHEGIAKRQRHCLHRIAPS